MKNRREAITLLAAAAAWSAGTAARGLAQSSSPGFPSVPGAPVGANPPARGRFGMPEGDPQMPPGMQQRVANAQNTERQKRLVADTDKLLALATQLKADVGKTDKNILSLDVVKRAEEIEKLARAVKDRMRN